MKVFQIGHAYTPNSGMGVFEYMYQITNQLSEKGIEVGFIQFDREGEELEEEQVNGITILHFPKPKFKGLRLSTIFSKWIDKFSERKDIIFHLHSVFYLPNFTIAQVLRKKKIGYIFTPHDSYSPESMRNNKILKKIFLQVFDKVVMNGAKAVHAITAEGMKHIAKNTANKNIKLITNFAPIYSPLEGVKIKQQLCYIGRMDIHQKGLDLMLETFALFLQEQPNVVLVIVGRYTEKELAEFTKLLISYKLDFSQVKVVGYVNNEEKYRILNESYAYFQLSRFEGFGLSIVEALSVGKPVIISDSVPISDIIHRYQAGYIAANVAEALTSLKKVFNLSQEEYTLVGKNAKRCQTENFHPDITTRKLIDLYEVAL